MNFAQEAYIRSSFNLSREEIGRRMMAMEVAQGFTIVTEAPWLDWNDWTEWTIISRDHDRIRLVALEARQPGQKAFSRLIRNVTDAGLIPVLVEPNRTLIDWCERHDYRSRRIGKGPFAHEVWYPRHGHG